MSCLSISIISVFSTLFDTLKSRRKDQSLSAFMTSSITSELPLDYIITRTHTVTMSTDAFHS